jgi:CoA:oxalate CoA-transferase
VPEALAAAERAGRDMILTVRSASGDTVRLLGDPIRYANRARLHRYPPRLDQDTDRVLTGLGVEPDQLRRLRAECVVGSTATRTGAEVGRDDRD